jgi:hypothetical protein
VVTSGPYVARALLRADVVAEFMVTYCQPLIESVSLCQYEQAAFEHALLTAV